MNIGLGVLHIGLRGSAENGFKKTKYGPPHPWGGSYLAFNAGNFAAAQSAGGNMREASGQ